MIRPIPFACLGALALASNAFAHVNLIAPNGGEVLEVGTTVTIEWQIGLAHDLLGWDLEYSTTGQLGPYTSIATGLPPGDPAKGSLHSFDWLVPDDPSNNVFVRVVMVNDLDPDYEDRSFSALAIQGGVGTPSCFGVGCPCGNDSPGSGCVNSTFAGATLFALGTASVAADDLLLVAANFPPDNSGLFFMGENLQAPVDVGDGLACTGGLYRFFPSTVSPVGELTLSSPIAAAPEGTIAAGETRHFQAWSRDVLCGPPPSPCPSPCMANSALSHALSVAFVP